ncbi:hypothetical protein H4R20_000258 [Coemansia guatemalensis]|uniref:PH domain-containing protein n=1 Tax=Coemansia guatemalensis TaxID=2761395 RepID=A0A9W8LVM3_9FUNG|nr:hypothetical protein H4R20_000258 [Coemansia guatemalensis]
MTGVASSALPLPAAADAAPQPASTASKPALTFSASTKFAATPVEPQRSTQIESDDAGSDPDDQVANQLDSMRERLCRDRARDAIKKEQVHMEGFLYKKAGGGASKAWNKRWCVLRSQALLIYKRLSEKKLKRIIRADEIVDVRHVSRRNHEFVFEIETPLRSFFFEASSEQELDTWLVRLQSVVSAVNSNSDTASNNRRSSDSRHATAPRASAHSITDAFMSLPVAPTASRRAQDPAHAIFSANDTDNAATNEECVPVPTEKRPPRSDPIHKSSTFGLRIEPPRSHAALQFSGDHPAEIVTALPPGIDPGHEPGPIADAEGCDDDDDEPNFNVDQRGEIEMRLEEDRVIMRGYLLKQDKLRQWRRRWFVLRQNTLSYYHDNKEYEVKQILRHHDIYDVRAPDPSTAKAKSLHRTYFKVVAAKRNYWLAHDDAAKAREWFDALLKWNQATDAGAATTTGSHSLPTQPATAAGHIFPAATEQHFYRSHPPPIIRHASSNVLGQTR